MRSEARPVASLPSSSISYQPSADVARVRDRVSESRSAVHAPYAKTSRRSCQPEADLRPPFALRVPLHRRTTADVAAHSRRQCDFTCVKRKRKHSPCSKCRRSPLMPPREPNLQICKCLRSRKDLPPRVAAPSCRCGPARVVATQGKFLATNPKELPQLEKLDAFASGTVCRIRQHG
jgi:hypothetical protein